MTKLYNTKVKEILASNLMELYRKGLVNQGSYFDAEGYEITISDDEAISLDEQYRSLLNDIFISMID